MLGMDPNMSFTTDEHTTNPVSLIYTSGIYIAINNIGNANIDTGVRNQSSNCLIRIPITQPSNTILQFFSNQGFKNLMASSILNQLDISILDDDRQPLQLTGNVEWTIVLRIDFEKSMEETVEKTRIQKIKDGTPLEKVNVKKRET
jgi:hypothetical protein